MKINFKNVKPTTYMRVAFLLCALVNQVIAICGAIYGEANIAYQIASVACTVVTALVCAWYNNDFTEVAQICGEIYNAIKKKKIEVEVEVEKNDSDKG